MARHIYNTMIKYTIIFLCLCLMGCRDIIVNVPDGNLDMPSISGIWEGEFGAYDANGQITAVEADTRRRDAIRLAIGSTEDRYSVHGVWEISVYGHIEQGFTSASYPFSSSMIDVGSGMYSMRLYVNQGSAVYEMWLDGDVLIVHRPDTGYNHRLTRVTA
jgi:hypothetical protein